MEHPEEKRAQKPKAITPFHFYALSKKEKFVKRHPEVGVVVRGEFVMRMVECGGLFVRWGRRN